MNNYVINEEELRYLLEQIRASQHQEVLYEIDGEPAGIVELVESVIKSRPLTTKNEP
jgi:hypothetical protein